MGGGKAGENTPSQNLGLAGLHEKSTERLFIVHVPCKMWVNIKSPIYTEKDSGTC
jgi:hypothetical protein